MNLEQNPLSFADTKMIAALGIPMVNSEGSPRIELWDKIWTRVIRLRGKQYRLPGGALGRKVPSKYAEEINALACGLKKSEVSVCFIPLMLQKNKDFTKSKDIRRLIERRLKLWDAEKYEILIQEAEMCDKKFPTHTTKMTEEQAIKVFTRDVRR